MKTQLLPIAALGAALLLAAAPSLAGPTEDAKVLFNVGAQAYEKGSYATALEAFEQAYRLAPRPGILFSIAQAHRKQYYTGGRQVPELKAAIAAYRDYLAKVDQGGRRSDAAEALVELESIAARMDPATMAAAQAPVAAPPATRIMVTTQTPDATIALDGGPPRGAPLVADVTPGKHSLRLSAPGFVDEARDVDMVAGSVLPLDVALRERPALLSVRALQGSQISIDGRFAAAAPLAQPLEVPPGHHLVTVTHNGYHAATQEIDLGRGEARSLSVHLDGTTQRGVSYAMMAGGAAGVVAGGVLAGVAIHYQQQAKDFDQQRMAGAFSCPTPSTSCAALFGTYTGEVQSRDDFARDAGIVIGAGVAVGVVGLMLFAFDQPVVGATAHRDDTPKLAAPPPRPMEMSLAPLLGPGLGGAALGGRF